MKRKKSTITLSCIFIVRKVPAQFLAPRWWKFLALVEGGSPSQFVLMKKCKLGITVKSSKQSICCKPHPEFHKFIVIWRKEHARILHSLHEIRIACNHQIGDCSPPRVYSWSDHEVPTKCWFVSESKLYQKPTCTTFAMQRHLNQLQYTDP